MKGIIFFSLGLMMLLLALSCDAACKAVGVENIEKVPDGRMTASTTLGDAYQPYYGRLNSTRGRKKWCPKKRPYKSKYLQVDMGAAHSVCAVATQRKGPGYTKTYYLQFSLDGVTWNVYKENNAKKIFAGSTEGSKVVRAPLDHLVKARFVRFYPIKYEKRPCLSVEIYSESDKLHACPNNHGFAFNECGKRCTCIDGQLSNCVDIRIRREFKSMTKAERARYISAVKKASTDPKIKTDYENLLATHRSLFRTEIHQQKHFLTWHRYFVLRYENLLRRADCGVTAVYWDWSSNNPFDTSDEGVWNDQEYGFGGSGSGESMCVPTGPFRESEWSILPPSKDSEISNKNCLARNFSQTPNQADVRDLLKIPAYHFNVFEKVLRDVLHFQVHLGVGGTMFTNNSAAAPEFFLHHTMVDKIWYDWQKISGANKEVFFYDVTELLPNTTIMPYQVIDSSNLPEGVRVEYQSKDNAKFYRRGQSLAEKPRISRKLDPRIINLFNVSPEEVKELKEMEDLVKPRNNAYRYE